jgi:hypothetical protein
MAGGRGAGERSGAEVGLEAVGVFIMISALRDYINRCADESKRLGKIRGALREACGCRATFSRICCFLKRERARGTVDRMPWFNCLRRTSVHKAGQADIIAAAAPSSQSLTNLKPNRFKLIKLPVALGSPSLIRPPRTSKNGKKNAC